MNVLVECFSRGNVKWCWLKWLERKCFWCLLEQSNVKFKNLECVYFKKTKQLRQRNRKFSVISVFNEAQHSDCKTLQTVSCFKSQGSFEITSLQQGKPCFPICLHVQSGVCVCVCVCVYECVCVPECVCSPSSGSFLSTAAVAEVTQFDSRRGLAAH